MLWTGALKASYHRSVRLFIAVPLSAAVRAEAEALLGRLSAVGADFRWVKPEALHVTLSFLGDTDPKKVPEIERAMRKAARRRAFEMSLGRLGAFDSLDDPNIIWLGLERGADELRDVASCLPQLPGRAFIPHLTLGRMRSRKGLGKLKSTLRTIPPLSAAQLVDRIVLYESRLEGGPPVHAPVLQVLVGG